MSKKTYMFIGAHPDDADIHFGGTTVLLKELGHDVVFVSVTDGSAGHHKLGREEVAARRLEETRAVAKFLGIRYIVMDISDGELTADLATRYKLIRLIREIRPDVIVSPRPNDYHPDHRAAGQLVQDASFLLTVPLVCPDTPCLERNPYIFYNQDTFTRPTRFSPEVVTDITKAVDKKMESLGHHESQVFEWLPFIYGIQEPVPGPNQKEERLTFLKKHWGDRGGMLSFVPLLNDPNAQFAEALERCEYGSKVTREIAADLFPFALINFKD